MQQNGYTDLKQQNRLLPSRIQEGWTSLDFWDVQCMLRAKSLQLCPTLGDPIGCSPPGSSVHGILQARILEWVARPSSKGSSQSRDGTHIPYVYCIGRRVLHHLPQYSGSAANAGWQERDSSWLWSMSLGRQAWAQHSHTSWTLKCGGPCAHRGGAGPQAGLLGHGWLRSWP